MKNLVSLTLVLVLCFTVLPSAFAIEIGEKVVVADPTYDNMTDAELYELAKKEGGTITVYSQTSTIGKAVEAFKADYPELSVEYYELGAAAQIEKVQIEGDSGNVVGDVLLMDDGLGVSYSELYGDYLEAYYPADIIAHMDQSVLGAGLAAYDALNIWYYNTDQYPDGAPIKTWWDVLERDENGNQKYLLYMPSITGNAQLAVFANLSSYSDELAKVYEEEFGTPLEYTYDPTVVPVPENNAGYEFLYRLAQMKIGFIKDGDDIVQAVGQAPDICLGFCTANKLDKAIKNSWPCAWVTKLAPYASMHNPKFLFLAAKTDNPIGARLLVRYLMGGDTGSNGAMDAFYRLGTWFFRDDVVDTANKIAITDIDTVPQNSGFIYDTYLDIRDFWTYWSDHFAQ